MSGSTTETPGSTAQMRLLWSSRSPFVRKVLIAAHELGIADRLECVPAFVTSRTPAPDVEAFNPLGQIPTLVTEEGTAIFDSTAIIDYLDARFGNHRLLPALYPRRLDVLKRSALAQGIKEKTVRWLSERFRPEDHQDAELIVGIARTLKNSLDAFERDAERWQGLPVDAGHIGLAAALGYLDFRFPQVAWREGRPVLEDWHDGFARRRSYIATEFVDPNAVSRPRV